MVGQFERVLHSLFVYQLQNLLRLQIQRHLSLAVMHFQWYQVLALVAVFGQLDTAFGYPMSSSNAGNKPPPTSQPAPQFGPYPASLRSTAGAIAANVKHGGLFGKPNEGKVRAAEAKMAASTWKKGS
jgi:hypothetical protein